MSGLVSSVQWLTMSLHCNKHCLPLNGLQFSYTWMKQTVYLAAHSAVSCKSIRQRNVNCCLELSHAKRINVSISSIKSEKKYAIMATTNQHHRLNVVNHSLDEPVGPLSSTQWQRTDKSQSILESLLWFLLLPFFRWWHAIFVVVVVVGVLRWYFHYCRLPTD